MGNRRLSKLRKTRNLRDMVAETKLHSEDFVVPYFVVKGEGVKKEINSMPGVYKFSIDKLVEDIQKTGVDSVLIFGVPETKDEAGSIAFREEGIIQEAIRILRQEFPKLTIISDVCLCGFTTHGHCGVIKDGELDNAETIDTLGKIALSHAQAGADLVAPSAMADYQVDAIRKKLDKKHYQEVGIMSYSAKYASNFYTPFRDIFESSPEFGDRKGYQMDYRNSEEALEEIKQDIEEGADIVMVKPALSYLDVISKVNQQVNLPVAAYNVSGEYSMIKKASKGSEELEQKLALEILTSIKRAGANIIISYFGRYIKQWIK